MPANTKRPRLAGHIAARRHIVDGEGRILLQDLRSERFILVGEREWEVVTLFDGTREREGILAAARLRGRALREEHLESFLDQLASLEWLDDGIASLAERDSDGAQLDECSAITQEELRARRAEVAERPLLPLPSYGFQCDGRGTCCNQFQTILFSPTEALNARVLCPERLECAEDESRLFTPERGTGLDPLSPGHGVRSVAVVDGSCAFLDEERLCRLHRLGGEEKKPAGCALYPLSFTDDGEAILVTVVPECACVFRSARAGESSHGLIPANMRHGRDLPEAAHVQRLPETVRITGSRSVPRTEYVAWSKQLLKQLEASPWPNAAATLWLLADQLEQQGLGFDSSSIRSAQPPSHTELHGWLAALGARARWRSKFMRNWCGAQDYPLLATSAIAMACELDTLSQPTASNRDDETFYCRTSFYGHLVVGDRPLSTVIRDRAIRLFVARSLITALPDNIEHELPEHLLEHPIAIVEAMLRGQGLSRYTDEVER